MTPGARVQAAIECLDVILAGEPAEVFRTVLMWGSVAAMTLGNLAALRQGDFKRLLGYSAVLAGAAVVFGFLWGAAGML